MPLQAKAIPVRGLSETRNGVRESTLPKEIEKSVNKQLAAIGDDVEATLAVGNGPDAATIIVIYKISESELKKKQEAEAEGTDAIGVTISLEEANRRAIEEKRRVDGDEMDKAEAKFQEDLRSPNEEEVEEEDEHGNKRKVKKRRSR